MLADDSGVRFGSKITHRGGMPMIAARHSALIIETLLYYRPLSIGSENETMKGTAKVIRSIALQMRNFQYVEAAKLMGQSDLKVIFKHIIPQLLPLTFASVAISVPGAILAEAGLSFLGLGDPSLPTWGQILRDANTADAAARGLWWWIIPPGLMIALTGLAFFLIGNTLDSIANPLRNKKKKA